MKNFRLILVIALLAVTLVAGVFIGMKLSASVTSPANVVVAIPARAGAVNGTQQNSDEFIWRLFVAFVAPISTKSPSPVIFETWASDADTFTKTPAWPDPSAPKKFQTSQLLLARSHSHQGIIDVPCKIPTGPNAINAPVGGFPTTGSPTPCIAEEVKRNKDMFDYIVDNSLNTQAGLATAYKKGTVIDMPTPSIAVKGHSGGRGPTIVAQTMGAYNSLVDLDGHAQTGGKTVLYLIDALYATKHNEYRLDPTCKWESAPFNKRWTASLFAAQDGVAIDSVALDFLRNEPTLATIVTGAVDNYLHEMAQANQPPSKTAYDPEKDGKLLASLGVHEHWNNAADKKYSRNLGSGAGIELVALNGEPAPVVTASTR